MPANEDVRMRPPLAIVMGLGGYGSRNAALAGSALAKRSGLPLRDADELASFLGDPR